MPREPGGVCFDLTESYTAIWTAGILRSAFASAVSFAIKEGGAEDGARCTAEEAAEFA